MSGEMQIEPDTPLMAFTVPLEALEDITGECNPAECLLVLAGLTAQVHPTGTRHRGPGAAGMRLFPRYLDEPRRAALDEAALAVQDAGRRELQALRGRSARLPQPLLQPAPQAPLLLPLPDPSSAELTAAAAAAAAEAGLAVPRGVAAASRVAPRGAGTDSGLGRRGVRQRGPEVPREAKLRGAAHVCEHIVCKLPAADWYKASKQQRSVPAL